MFKITIILPGFIFLRLIYFKGSEIDSMLQENKDNNFSEIEKG